MSPPQYQHFMPQFLIRNFSHPYKPEGGRKRGKRKNEKGLYYNESVVRTLDLTTDDPVFREVPVKQILGQMNAYEVAENASGRQRSIESMLGKLESQAARVFRKIIKAYEEPQDPHQGTAAVCLTRGERNLLRKFIFLLKYRAFNFHRRFNRDTPEEYMSSDRELMLEYMAEKGYKRPLDVWFDNIQAIIDIEIDVEDEWTKELPKRMYPLDALWFIGDMEGYYTAICTPSDPYNEFILTDASCGIFEGPHTCTENEETGVRESSIHTPLHMFTPVSPKLMIVLRDCSFPDPLEDANEDIRKWKEQVRQKAEMLHGDQGRGILHDLPVAKPSNSYSSIIDGAKLEFHKGHDGKIRMDDKFTFPFFPISTRHINLINGIFLDNSGRCSNVVFNTKSSFAKTLEWYLTTEDMVKITDGFVEDGQREAVQKLEIASRSLGSTGMTITTRLDPIPAEIQAHRRSQVMLQKTSYRFWKNAIFNGEEVLQHESSVIRFYLKTAGDFSITFSYDLDQARKMWALLVIVQDLSECLAEHIRQRNYHLLLEAYLRLPPARFALYAKFSRAMILGELYILENGDFLSGPEDALLEGKYYTIQYNLNFDDEPSLTNGVEAGVFEPEVLNLAVYGVVSEDMERILS